MNQDRARELISTELERLDADAETEIRDRASQVPSDHNGEGMDIGDSGAQVSESMDRDLTIGTLRRRREQLLAALERSDRGTYGTCAVCGRAIDDERLEARPETERCREHAEGAADITGVEA